MARLSLKGTLKKSNSGALLTVNEALRGLVNSLDMLQEVESSVETSGPHHIGSHQITPRFLRLVAGTLKEMVGKLVSDIEAQPEIQTLLRTIQKSVTNGDNAGTNQPPGALPCEPVCKSGICSRTSKRAAVRGAGRCRHACEHHPEVLDPVLWSTLPEEVVELVFGKLPIAKIVHLCSHSKAWSMISKSSNFRQACFERNPKLFGLVGRDKGGRTVCNRAYDINSKTWISRDVGGFPRAFDLSPDDRHGYDDSLYACDGGLVCFVPRKNVLVHPILVGNPLTDEWKPLPQLHLKHRKPILMQLVMGDEYYRVILVWRDYAGGALSANYYDSRTSEWSTMHSGLVYGGCNTLFATSVEAPFVFDCATKRLFNLSECAALEDVPVIRFSMVRDRVFVLHKCNRGRHASSMYKVSDYAWDGRALDLSKLSTIDSTLSRGLPRTYVVHMFSTSGFVLLVGGNTEEDEDQHQLMRLLDLDTDEWHCLDMGEEYRFSASELDSVYMCELRWNAVP